MSLLSGAALDYTRFFSVGTPAARGSSFDLTIGSIFNPKGENIEGIYELEPGHMVQVVSAEVFSLPETVTGHVTYKTGLTKLGIWALTIGIVDPGWNGPVTTTLFNFSKVPYVLRRGTEFLRVSLFEHAPVSKGAIRSAPPEIVYLNEAQERAVTRFPSTFMNQGEISKRASDSVLESIQKQALIWVGAIAFLFSVIQWVQNSAYRGSMLEANAQLVRTQSKVDDLNARLIKLEMMSAPAPMTVTRPAPPPVVITPVKEQQGPRSGRGVK